MSTSKNPLHEYHSVRHKHVLVAFQYMQDASTYEITPEIGKIGKVVGTGCGNGVVIVNEFKDARYYINDATWEYNYYGLNRPISSSSNGVIEITEKIGLSFLDFLLTEAIPALGDVTVSHAGFAIKTFFLCQKTSNSTAEIITGNPYVFNVPNIVSGVNNQEGIANTHNLLALGASQSVGQLPSYSQLSQMTITHKDQNPNKEVPTPDGASSGLKYRGQEDSKYGPRKTRLDKSKPMKTLKDAFEAFEVELDSQKFSHKAQLQQWLRNVRDDHVDKIEVPPEQKKKPDGEPLPIIFKVKLDPKYNSYQINNRNIPFEQPEQGQEQDGIRTIPVGTGDDIIDAVKTICNLSKKMGEDALEIKPKVPKVTITAVRECDKKMHITVIVKKTELPTNSMKLDTGAGQGAVSPLEFIVNSNKTDRDIISIQAKLTYQVGGKVLEKHVDSPEANLVYGDREQVTIERSVDIDYFKTMNSGTRVNECIGRVNGKEHGDLSANVSALHDKQTSIFNVKIRGNPHLMSDVNRKPTDVAGLSAGETHYYAFPEYYAMYLKIKLYERSYKTIGNQPADETDISDIHYFDKYYHISKVRNTFSVQDDSGDTVRGFHQELELRRTDDYM